LGLVVNPIWLLTMKWTERPRHSAQLREREALGHHALAREGRVAVHQQRQDMPRPAWDWF